MGLVGHQKIECALRQVALDELGRLVAALAEAELHRGHGPFHPTGLPIGKHQLAVAVHEVDELMDVVSQHAGQEPIAELLHQPLGGDFPDGRDAFEGLENRR